MFYWALGLFFKLFFLVGNVRRETSFENNWISWFPTSVKDIELCAPDMGRKGQLTDPSGGFLDTTTVKELLLAGPANHLIRHGLAVIPASLFTSIVVLTVVMVYTAFRF